MMNISFAIIVEQTLNIHSNNRGVSMKNAVVGYVLMYIAMMIVSLMLNQIPIVADYASAL